MTGKALFALGLRILGLIFMYHAVSAAIVAGSALLGGFPVWQGVVLPVFQCLAYTAASLWLIGGAPWLFRWAFREHKGETAAQREAERADG